MGIEAGVIAAIAAATSTAVGVAGAIQQAGQQKKARQSATQAAAEQARQLRAAAAQERDQRLRRLQIAQGRTVALSAASGGVDGTGDALLGQLVRDAQADLATTSANTANRLGSNSAQLSANIASIGSTNLGLSIGQSLMNGATTGLGAYSAATQVNEALSPPAPTTRPAVSGSLQTAYAVHGIRNP